jgi:hypothetical protein
LENGGRDHSIPGGKIKSAYLMLLLFPQLLLILFVFNAQQAFCGNNSIRFSREKITMSIGMDHILLEGRYIFRNDGEDAVKGPLFYPFPVDSNMLYPDSINVSIARADGTLEDLRYNKTKKGITFGVEYPRGGTREVVVTYRQRVKAQTARYILTTAQSWGRSLEEAEFFIEVPHNLEIRSISYGDFELWKGEDRYVYHMRKVNFLPVTDILVAWKEKQTP